MGKLNENLTKDFFIGLGEIRSLRVINMDKSGVLNHTIAELLGKAIAFNAKRKGSLENVSLRGCMNFVSVEALYQGMHVSE